MRTWTLVGLGVLLFIVSCTHTVKVEPIKVEPIHITMDIYIKVDRELHDFFSFEDKIEQTMESSAGTSP